MFISETGENSGKIATIPSFVKHSVSSVGVFDTAWLFRETTSAPPPVILQLDYIHALRTKMPAPQYQSQTKRRGSLSAASRCLFSSGNLESHMTRAVDILKILHDIHFRSVKWQAADKLREVKPELKRFDELVTEIKTKTQEHKALTAEKKQTLM